VFADGSVLFKEPFAALPEWLAHYSEAEETVAEEIIKMSPSTIDCRLSSYKAETGIKLRTVTKPGFFLRLVIPIRSHNNIIRALEEQFILW